MEKKNIMKIDFANLRYQYKIYEKDINEAISKVLKNCNFIMGEEIYELEKKLEKFTDTNYAVVCSSGTDALLLSLMAMNIQPGDEIITTPFTWISTAETIALLKAKPVFVDIEEDSFNIDANLIESVITRNTKAIMPVSLFGQPADLDEIQSIADKHSLKVIIDGAQSFGSTYNDKNDSNFGDVSTTSFFPSKPFGCYGDGGAVFTNNENYAKIIKMLRVHGQFKRNHHEYIGIGGRLDTLQASILLAKLPYFTQELKDRQKVAARYTKGLSDFLLTPKIKKNRTSTWAQYTIRFKNRDILQKKLIDNGVPTSIFYPVPLHLQKCFKYLNCKKGDFPIAEKVSDDVISLPMNAFLTNDQTDYVIKKIKENI